MNTSRKQFLALAATSAGGLIAACATNQGPVSADSAAKRHAPPRNLALPPFKTGCFDITVENPLDGSVMKGTGVVSKSADATTLDATTTTYGSDGRIKYTAQSKSAYQQHFDGLVSFMRSAKTGEEKRSEVYSYLVSAKDHIYRFAGKGTFYRANKFYPSFEFVLDLSDSSKVTNSTYVGDGSEILLSTATWTLTNPSSCG